MEGGRSAVLLAEDGVVGALTGQDRSQLGLDGFVGIGDRGQVRFGLDAQIQRPEPVEGDRVGPVGEFHRHREVCLYIRSSWQQSYHGRMWEFAVLLLIVGALVLILAPRIMGRRGPRGEMAQGTLLVTGVSPRPDATGEQFVTISGVINGPTVNEHVVYQRMAVDVNSWPTMGQLIPVAYSPKNPDNWYLAPARPPQTY